MKKDPEANFQFKNIIEGMNPPVGSLQKSLAGRSGS